MSTRQRRGSLPLLAIALLLGGCGALVGAANLPASATIAAPAAARARSSVEPLYLDDRSDAVAVPGGDVTKRRFERLEVCAALVLDLGEAADVEQPLGPLD